jgi:hypothetical protein
MGEPLCDEISAALIGSGLVSIWLLRSANAETANLDRARRLTVIGHLWLGLAISLLLYRWIDALTSLPSALRPNLWRSGALTATCGIGLAAAVKAVIGEARRARIRNFAIASACGVVALGIAAAWNWAFLVLMLLIGSLTLATWNSKRVASAVILDDERTDQSREPVLVCLVGAAVLLLLLGTWQHVVEYEAQRTTRSPRFSAWPRPSALRDAWERTDWTTKRGAADSSARVAKSASHEQRVALGLGLCLLVVSTFGWHKSHPKFVESEADHAG